MRGSHTHIGGIQNGSTKEKSFSLEKNEETLQRLEA